MEKFPKGNTSLPATGGLKPSVRNRKVVIAKLVYIILICGFAFLACLKNINKGLWYDEAVQFWDSVSPLSEVLTNVRFHSQDPPLYHFLLHFWLLFGQSVFWMRLLSILAGMGSVVLSFFIGREIFRSDFVGFLGAFLFAIFPLQTYYFLEIKPYGLLILFSLAALLVFLKLLEKGSGKYLALFSLFSLLAVYTHYSAVILLVAYNIAYLVFRKKFPFSWKKWFRFQFVVFLLVLLLIPLTLRYQIGVASSMYGGNSSFSLKIFFVRVKDVVLEYFVFGLTRKLLPVWLTKVAKKLFAFCFLGGMFSFFRERSHRVVGALLLTLLLSSLFLFYAADFLGVFPFGGRHMMVASIFFYPFLWSLVWGLGRIKSYLAALPLFLIFLTLWPFTPFGKIGTVNLDAGMGKIVSFLVEESTPEDLIIIDNGAQILFSYYYWGYRNGPEAISVDRENLSGTGAIGIIGDRNNKRVWFVFTSSVSPERTGYMAKVKQEMSERYRLSEEFSFAESNVFLLERLD